MKLSELKRVDMQDIFFLHKSKYNTPLNPLQAYLSQLTTYIQTKTGWDIDKSKAKAKEIVRTHFKDPAVKCFERIENGDKIVKDTTLYTYMVDNLKSKNILAPTFTSYMSTAREKSILSDFIFVAVSKRSKAKKEMHKAKADGNTLLYDNKNNEQNNLKTYANSMSGAFAQEACILNNPPNHSTLTSIVRTMTSLSNASNERIIAGNRYYPRGIDVLNNIVFISGAADQEAIKRVVEQYDLYIPSVRETVDVLKRSSDLYFHDGRYYQQYIIPYLEKLTKYQRVAICYSGDLYHIRNFNSKFIRNLLNTLASKQECEEADPDILSKIYTIDENILNFVHHIFFNELKGKGNDYAKMNEPLLVTQIYKTGKAVEQTLIAHKNFFNTFFMSAIMPNNSFRLKNMRRRTVVLSDTDSTCFTLDEWIKWYGHGEFNINSKTIAIGGAIAYITTQSIVHLLRTISCYLGVDPDLIDKLAMKNEFLWLLHVPAEVSKHYYALTVLQEGNVLKNPEMEIKGVHLKNSSVAKTMIDDAKNLMQTITTKISTNEKIKLNDVLRHIINLEKSVIASVHKGESLYLKKSKIKTKDSYLQEPARSPYGRHLFWNEVFGLKYGDFIDPPYDVVKIPTIVKTKTALKAWVDSIEDADLKVRLEVWLNKNNKSNLPTIYLHDGYVLGSGMPKEIINIININRIVLDVTMQHRVILETLGVLLYPDRLVSEQFQL